MKQVIASTAQANNVTLLDYEAVVDHVHMLLQVEPNQSLSRIMNLLKGISSRKVFQQFPELKLDAGENHLWQKRYASKIVSPTTVRTVSDYIRTQKERLEKFEH